MQLPKLKKTGAANGRDRDGAFDWVVGTGDGGHLTGANERYF